MGVDLYLEDEQGNRLAEVLDPRGFVPRILLLAEHASTVCLRFIDPYGDSVFNQLQIPVLIRELEHAREMVTDEGVARLGRQAVEDARRAGWASTVVQAIDSSNRASSASDIRSHLERVLAVARRAQGQVHTYLRFEGD
jgi:hypothetical protein